MCFVLGRRTVNRIAMRRELEIPKSLGGVISGIGTILVQSGAYMVRPESEPAVADQGLKFNNAVTFQMLTQFSSLIQAAKVRNIMHTSTVTAAIEGTACQR